METMNLALFDNSITELEQYKALLIEGCELLGIDSTVYDKELKYLVSHAIAEAVKHEREYVEKLKKRNEEQESD